MEGDRDRRRWAVLGLLSSALFLGMIPWLVSSALGPHFASLWGLSPRGTGWLSSLVQLGFVAGTAVLAILNLPDLLPSRALFSTSAALVALSNAALLLAPPYVSFIPHTSLAAPTGTRLVHI